MLCEFHVFRQERRSVNGRLTAQCARDTRIDIRVSGIIASYFWSDRFAERRMFVYLLVIGYVASQSMRDSFGDARGSQNFFLVSKTRFEHCYRIFSYAFENLLNERFFFN